MTPVGSSTATRSEDRTNQLEWRISDGLVPYPQAIDEMEARVAAIRAGQAPELCWLLEHPPLYTAGTSAKEQDLLEPSSLPVFKTGRGGQYTYHGPGQRIGYVMLDLQQRGRDLRRYIWRLEAWVIRTLEQFGVHGERREGRVGIWVAMPGGSDAKIAAIGVRIRRWVTYHGVSINVAPDLDGFSGIVPCGIKDAGVTSLDALGLPATISDVDRAMMDTFEEVFGAP
ncbi:MAG: lipoyl(octanoyl) transferase LipB [Pseudomonadota bacterium]